MRKSLLIASPPEIVEQRMQAVKAYFQERYAYGTLRERLCSKQQLQSKESLIIGPQLENLLKADT